MSATNLYYLTASEIQHYCYMLEHGYSSKLVAIDGQQYLVFPVLDKKHAGIAWPTVTGKLDGASRVVDTKFQHDEKLQQAIMPHISGSTIATLVFPQYAR